MSRPIRPPMPTYNSWDSIRYSQRAIPLDAIVENEHTITPTDTFNRAPTIEARRPSIRVDERDPVTPTLLYRLGWRSIVQIWAALATTTTFCIASANLYNRLHNKAA